MYFSSEQFINVTENLCLTTDLIYCKSVCLTEVFFLGCLPFLVLTSSAVKLRNSQ